METISAIIVEDELKSQNTLRNMLYKYCPEVKVIGEAKDIQEARKIIQSTQPQLVFLDIELPRENGLQLFNYFPRLSFEVIFTTAYNQYAVQAFRLAALDYLLKPINAKELQNSIHKLKEKIATSQNYRHLELLIESYEKGFQKIALPTSEGYSFLELDQIIYCNASRSYTVIYLTNQQKIIISKPLKFLDDTLPSSRFFRINRSQIINLKYIEKYSRASQGEITLTNGIIISISEHKKARFLKLVVGR